MNNSLHSSTSSNEGEGDDTFINETPDGMENYIEGILFPMLDEGSLDHAILESLFYNEISLMNSSTSSNSIINGINVHNDSTAACDTDSFLLPQVQSASENISNGEHSFLPEIHQQDTQSRSASFPAGVMPPNASQNEMFAYNTNAYQATDADTFGYVGSSEENLRSNDSSSSIVADQSSSRNVGLHSDPHPQGVGSAAGITKSGVAKSRHRAPSSAVPRKLSVQLPKHTILNGGGIRHNVLPVLDKNDAERTELPPPTAENAAKILTNPTSPAAEEKKRKKLISQFATLAGRLGITLPPQVLQKLTDKAADATKIVSHAKTLASDPTSVPIPCAKTVCQTTANDPQPVCESPLELAEDTEDIERQPSSSPQSLLLQQVRKSAVEAIAAVDNKRSNAASGISNNVDDIDGPTDSKPYSKKRKKPRLSDCEQKLAELQSENIILKRHLDNIANRNARLDEDRMTAEQQMRQMLHDNAPDSILDPIVKNFTEMYSDYGRKRHDELNFHLQQLQRLANPTNFTKMGLWTLGGGVQSSSASSPNNGSDGSTKVSVSSPNGGNVANNRGNNGSKNPIAGMLQRELGISTQQGRKILEQRQKIQNVCSNLKECLKLLAKLNQLCEKKTQMFHNRMTKCQQVLAPKQVVKLLIWIDDNSQTLGTVCPGWGSEQFQSKAPTTKKDAIQN